MRSPPQRLRLVLLATAWFAPVRLAANEPDVAGFRSQIAPFLSQYCVRCHGSAKQEAELRFDSLSGDVKQGSDGATWQRVLMQLETGVMPPPDAPRPTAEAAERVVRWLRGRLKEAGIETRRADESAYPGKGNLVDHDRLFEPSTAAPATPARIWRISPYAYRDLVDGLTDGRLIQQGGPAVRAKMIAIIATPFGLTADVGFRDYAFRYKVSGSETQQMAINAKIVVESMLTKRPPRYTPPKVLASIADSDEPPTDEQLRSAVQFMFQEVLLREPNDEEVRRYVGFASKDIERFGNRAGLIHGLSPILLHPEVVFRSEFGTGPADEHGRRFLAPMELAIALGYALTDDRPDPTLYAAARNDRLKTREDVRREVTRMLDDEGLYKPRILRFFREYFDYDKAPEVFKDSSVLVAAKLARDNGSYRPDTFVDDTDLLVEWVLESDRDVLRTLLTTDRSFVGYNQGQQWNKLRKQREDRAKKTGETLSTHPFNYKFPVDKYYGYDVAQWSLDMPLTLPSDQRAGVLTQPSWLIAHSSNEENHAIHRGKC